MGAIIGWIIIIALVVNFPVLLWIPAIWIALLLIENN